MFSVFTISTTKTGVVKDFYWERCIDIEKLTTVVENDWVLPYDARVIDKKMELRTYKDVLDHYETKTREYQEEVFDHYKTEVVGYKDLGNGYFEEIESQTPVYRTETRTKTYQEPVYRKEPVYDYKYYYARDVWKGYDVSKSSGHDKNPYWPKTNLSNEKYREGERKEIYSISILTDENKEEKYYFDFKDWKKIQLESEITIKTDLFGNTELIDEKGQKMKNE